MRFPWANTLLLLFLCGELVSGFFGLISGSEERAIHMQMHRVCGYGILAVLGWKAANVLRSLRWPRASAARGASLALGALLAATMTLGLAWSLFGQFHWWLFSGMSWHIYLGGALVPLLAWHAWSMVRGFPLRFWADRRLFLRASGLAIAGFAAWQLSEGVARAADLAGQHRRFTGSYEAKSFSGNDFPRVSWLNDIPPNVDAERWRLSVDGAVERPTALGYDDLTRRAEVVATIDCTGGWHSTQRWSGTPLADVLADAKPLGSARSVVVWSATGYYRRFSLSAADGFLLATDVGDERLSRGHGFPLRLVARERRGFEWVKWVERIEVSEAPAWWQPPLPMR